MEKSRLYKHVKNDNCLDFSFQNASRFAQQIERALADMRNLFLEWKKQQNQANGVDSQK